MLGFKNISKGEEKIEWEHGQSVNVIGNEDSEIIRFILMRWYVNGWRGDDYREVAFKT